MSRTGRVGGLGGAVASQRQSSCSWHAGVGWSARSLSFWEVEGAAGPARPGGW